jgi:hypothetical protein
LPLIAFQACRVLESFCFLSASILVLLSRWLFLLFPRSYKHRRSLIVFLQLSNKTGWM